MKPNIILINCDDLGYGDFGCYGSKKNHTPNIDHLADKGVRCTDFYMASPLCSPSRAAMLTGCYPPRISFGSFDGMGVLFPGQGIGLNPDELTLPRMLKEAGYSTCITGKWHCGDQQPFLPIHYGFDDYIGLPYSNDMGLQKNSTIDVPLPLLANSSVIEMQPDQTRLTDLYTRHAVSFIEGHAHSPFFQYMAHMHVHLPLMVHPRFKHADKTPYQCAVEAIDESTGEIIAALKRVGVYDNTIIIVTSDNGSRNDYGGSNGILRGGKGTTWEGGMRVPCIISWPQKHTRGTTYSGLFTSLDFLESLSIICGGRLDKVTRDSYDYSAVFAGDVSRVPERKAFYYYFMNDLEAVRYKDWKLHISKLGKSVRLLYNLAEDPSESNDLYGLHPELNEIFDSLIEKARYELGDNLLGVSGAGVRPCARVNNPVPLVKAANDDPLVVLMYDTDERG